MKRRLVALVAGLALPAVAAVAAVVAQAAAPRVRLAHQRLALAGAPAALFAVDLDADGRRDLALVVASTEWGEIGIEERQEIDELGAYVEVLTVVPALFDRRELALHRGRPDGTFEPEPLRLELPDTVHALFEGPAGTSLVAWTDEGISGVVFDRATGGLALAPRIAAPSPLAGSRAFLSDLALAHDLDGDGARDLLLPTTEGYRVHLAGADGFHSEPSDRFAAPLEERLPGDARHYRSGAVRHLPIPEVLDLDGDGALDLVFRNHDRKWGRMRLLRNLGGGRFAPPVDPNGALAEETARRAVWVGDLDGDGRAELVTETELEPEKDSMRAEMAQARRPKMRYGVHPLGPDSRFAAEPARTFELEGYVFGGGDLPLPLGVRELDGDGRPDLVALTLDFSMIQALRIVTLRSLRLGLGFEPHCQQPDGGFQRVAGGDLGGRFTLRLDRLRLGQLASFSGDFDGDGRADYLQLGRGREVAVRLGAPGCRYPEAAEATLELAAEPADLALVRVADLDGDGRSDLVVTHPPPPGEPGERGALDLYLSGEIE